MFRIDLPANCPGEENANCQRKSCCDSTENIITRDKVENEKASASDNRNQDSEIGWNGDRLPGRMKRNPIISNFSQYQAGILTPQTEAVGQGYLDLIFPGFIGYIIQIALWIG